MKKLIISGVCAAVFGTTFFAQNSFAETTSDNSNQNIKAASVQTSSFIDVPQSHWAYKEIQYMADHNIMRGFGNGYFGVKDKVTREELAVFLYRMIKIPDGPYKNPKPFNDIDGSNFKKEIVAVYNNGIFPYLKDEKFDPKRNITRAEIAVAFRTAFGLTKKFDHQFTDTQGHWASEEIKILYSNGITSGVGDNQFDPEGVATREQLAMFLYRAIPAASKPLQVN
ncbi:S-layer homology domain-containing protein [Bacillus sp. DX4.1]|uniref:S-layer homology domain-containing protein n=1 Tax=unclassified Bacillus (in: firmicutes) TaxID=185979 RepID=UPI0025A19C7B|nr:S-layer homology domain-containing protein [Bacillus sp. DX4.1]MDM5185915.1 S-layer homology domain-containing protein [Bacillus sp. DX4.1]